MITRNLPYFRRTELPTSTALPYFGRHEFDFENPEFVESATFAGEYAYTRYTCKKCKKIICLDDWQDGDLLPFELAYGCTTGQ